MRCQVSNTIIGSIIYYKYIFVGLLVAFLSTSYLKYKVDQYNIELIKVDALYYEVLRKLQKQAKLSKASTEVPSYIGSIQLRDVLLHQETNLTKKLHLWKKVSNKVEHNTNVKFESIENFGEIMKVWEWISEIEIDI